MTTPDREKTLCLDFDGVLHAYTSGWHGADVVADGPTPGAVAFLFSTFNRFQMAVVSSRSSQAGGIAAMRHAIWTWLDDEYGGDIADAIVSSIHFPESKPACFLTLDDRALTFTGTFPSPADITSFRPWNKAKRP